MKVLLKISKNNLAAMTFLSIFAKKSIIMKRPDIMTTVSLLVILGMAGACSDNNKRRCRQQARSF